MSTKKISELNNLNSGDLDSTKDILPIVNSKETKKITVDNLLGNVGNITSTGTVTSATGSSGFVTASKIQINDQFTLGLNNNTIDSSTGNFIVGGTNNIVSRGTNTLILGNTNYVNNVTNSVIGSSNSEVNSSDQNILAGNSNLLSFSDNSLIVGQYNTASKYTQPGSFTTGYVYNNIIGGTKNFVRGFATQSLARHAEDNIISGFSNTVEGTRRSIIAGTSNHSRYNRNIRTCDNLVTGNANTIEGSIRNTIAGGNNSIVYGENIAMFGSGNLADSSSNSFVFGIDNTLRNYDNVVLFGSGNLASSNSGARSSAVMFIHGQHNATASITNYTTSSLAGSPLLIVGNGTDNNNRSNKIEIGTDVAVFNNDTIFNLRGEKGNNTSYFETNRVGSWFSGTSSLDNTIQVVGRVRNRLYDPSGGTFSGITGSIAAVDGFRYGITGSFLRADQADTDDSVVSGVLYQNYDEWYFDWFDQYGFYPRWHGFQQTYQTGGLVRTGYNKKEWYNPDLPGPSLYQLYGYSWPPPNPSPGESTYWDGPDNTLIEFWYGENHNPVNATESPFLIKGIWSDGPAGYWLPIQFNPFTDGTHFYRLSFTQQRNSDYGLDSNPSNQLGWYNEGPLKWQNTGHSTGSLAQNLARMGSHSNLQGYTTFTDPEGIKFTYDCDCNDHEIDINFEIPWSASYDQMRQRSGSFDSYSGDDGDAQRPGLRGPRVIVALYGTPINDYGQETSNSTPWLYFKNNGPQQQTDPFNWRVIGKKYEPGYDIQTGSFGSQYFTSYGVGGSTEQWENGTQLNEHQRRFIIDPDEYLWREGYDTSSIHMGLSNAALAAAGVQFTGSLKGSWTIKNTYRSRISLRIGSDLRGIYVAPTAQNKAWFEVGNANYNVGGGGGQCGFQDITTTTASLFLDDGGTVMANGGFLSIGEIFGNLDDCNNNPMITPNGNKFEIASSTVMALGRRNFISGENNAAFGDNHYIRSPQCPYPDYDDNIKNVFAIGYNNRILANNAHAEGVGNKITGGAEGSHAEGQSTIVSGSYAHAEGGATIAKGGFAHSEGMGTLAAGDGAHAEGNVTFAQGNNSHTEGDGTRTFPGANGSHAEGKSTVTLGNHAHAEGWSTVASGSYSHTEGVYTATIGLGSHAEGYIAVASGDYSHAEGYSTLSSGSYSHAEGVNTTAKGAYSHAEGQNSIAYGDFSHAEGLYTIASGSNQTTMGRWNTPNTTSLVIIGSGESTNNRRNVAEFNEDSVTLNGNVTLTESSSGLPYFRYSGGRVDAGNAKVEIGALDGEGNTTSLTIDDANGIILTNLPTSKPATVGALWVSGSDGAGSGYLMVVQS